MSFCARRRRQAKASLTLEAAIVLPIFACFMVAILFFFRVVECQLALEKSMDYAVRKYASVVSDESMASGASALAFTTAYSRAKDYGESSDYPFWPKTLVLAKTVGDDMKIDANLGFTLPLPLIGTKMLFVNQKVVAREWVGYTGNGAGLDNAGDTIVYVTAGSSVYHLTTACTHLDLSVSAISGGDLPAARSAGGSKYTPCEHCKPAAGLSTYYITDEGTKYHSSAGCSALKRTYYTTYLSQVQDILKPCSRCGGGG